jgi:3-phenylpropionate/trans-cinnamate dioxygenase ferredoxin reductase subunit
VKRETKVEAYKYVIVGGGLAGQRGAEGIRKVDAKGSIALVMAEPYMPYERPPLSKGYLQGRDGLDKVFLKEDGYYAENGIDVTTGVHATWLAPDTRVVTLDDGRLLRYEKLLLATGGYARCLPIPGNDLPGVLTLRTIKDADAIRAAAEKAKQALVLGGSFIGSEVAASLAQLGLGVTMVFPESRLLELVAPEELSDWLRVKYEAREVRVLAGNSPDHLEGDDKVERAVLANGEVLDIDLVVMGVGVRLNTDLARVAGLEMTEKKAVLVDAYLRTSDPNIYAAGDIAAWPDPTFGKRLRVEHWDVARRQGLRAGQNMAGDEKPYTSLPYFFSDLFDFSFEVWGELTSWDQVVRRGALESDSFAHYYFDQGKLTGVLASGRPDEERKPMQALVKARPAYEDVAAGLLDENLDLNALVE